MTELTLFDTDETLTVGQICRRLGETIRKSWPHEVWVQGQIRNLSRSGRGHVYFDLVDPVPAGAAPRVSLAVTLFDSNRQIVNRIITRTGNTVRIDDGVEVRIRAGLEFYAPRGQLQLNMTSIDPEFTLGRLGADRERLLAQLRDEQLVEANAALELPLVPLRIALITSGGSAAHADFSEQIAASGYAFEITELASRVQGEFAAEEIAEAISAANQLPVDVIALVRGGGARTDLATFDTEPVARAICGSQVPVLCGIGHETDSSVADLVAHTTLKTPTACAQHLVERLVAFDFELAERARRLVVSARVLPQIAAGRLDTAAELTASRVGERLAGAARSNDAAATAVARRSSASLLRADRRLEAAATATGHRATLALTSALRSTDRLAERITDLAPRLLAEHARRLDVHEARLSAVDPVQAVRRGYSITTTADGRIVRSIHDVNDGDLLDTRLADGRITSVVSATGPEPAAPSSGEPT